MDNTPPYTIVIDPSAIPQSKVGCITFATRDDTKPTEDHQLTIQPGNNILRTEFVISDTAPTQSVVYLNLSINGVEYRLPMHPVTNS